MKSPLALVVVFSFMLLSSCHRDGTTPASGPVITAFTPSGGKAGDTVTITGSSFSAQLSGNTVTFSDTAATVITATVSTLTVIVPHGAVTGKIAVTTGGKTVVSASNFVVSLPPPPPVISSFAPALGVAGDTIIITGTGFSTVAGNNTVKFANNVTATVTAATATQLTVTVPAGAITGTVSATVNAQTAASASGFEVLQDIPRSGLVAFYPFSGDANDASGHAFNLTLEGTYAAAADRFGKPGKAWYFNGGNSYTISSNATQALAPQPLTVQVWVKYDSLIGSEIIGKYSYPPAAGYILGVSSDGSGAGMITLNMDNFYATSTAGVLPANTNGAWILIGITYDGSTLQFFKNGSLVTTIVHSGTITATSTGNLRIGLSGDGGTGLSAFKCSIDDATIYNRVLNSTEIQQLYTQTVSKK